MTIQINTAGPGTQAPTADAEYYILCPQRATEVPGLITHLISRDICDKRQSESYHKCPTCIRSAIFRARNGLTPSAPVNGHAVGSEAAKPAVANAVPANGAAASGHAA